MNHLSKSLVSRRALKSTTILNRSFSNSSMLLARKSALNTGILFVPQQQAYVVERFGKFQKVLSPGLNFLVPIIDNIKYVQSLKVETLEISNQSAVFTRDNVHLDMDGVLYYQVVDPVLASYEIEDAEFAIRQLAMSTMRSEIGQLTLDECFRERIALNHRIVEAINEAVSDYGIKCHRYEVREIAPNASVVNAMELEVVAERKRRQLVIESEGEKRAAINVAEGEKAAVVLASEAAAAEVLNMRRAEADGLLLVAQAQAAATSKIANVLQEKSGPDAASLGVAQSYIQAFGKLAKSSNTLVLPAAANDPASMVGQAMAIYGSLSKNKTNNGDVALDDGQQQSSSSSSSSQRNNKNAYAAEGGVKPGSAKK